MTTYRIRPLVWHDYEDQTGCLAIPIAGISYAVWKWYATGQLRWNYCENGKWSDEAVDAPDLESAKAAAESHWHDRLKQCLDPVTGEQA